MGARAGPAGGRRGRRVPPRRDLRRHRAQGVARPAGADHRRAGRDPAPGRARPARRRPAAADDGRVDLRAIKARLPDDPEAASALTDGAIAELAGATAELRELARGIHPPVLTEHGLATAVSTLAARAA